MCMHVLKTHLHDSYLYLIEYYAILRYFVVQT